MQNRGHMMQAATHSAIWSKLGNGRHVHKRAWPRPSRA